MAKISIKPGTTQQGPDGSTYRWLGAQWGKVSKVTGKTSRIATKAVGTELTKRFLSPSQVKGLSRLKKATQSSAKLGKAAKKSISVAWFKRKVGDMARGFTPTRSLSPGSMYTFVYDAKHKKTLPYWDKVPLVIVLDIAKDGFIGLNFHYLSPTQREVFLNKILKFANQKGDPSMFTAKAQFNMSWKAVQGIAGADKMIHKYLFKQIKSSMLEAPPNEWENVIYMPYQQFVGESAKSVWSK